MGRPQKDRAADQDALLQTVLGSIGHLRHARHPDEPDVVPLASTWLRGFFGNAYPRCVQRDFVMLDDGAFSPGCCRAYRVRPEAVERGIELLATGPAERAEVPTRAPVTDELAVHVDLEAVDRVVGEEPDRFGLPGQVARAYLSGCEPAVGNAGRRKVVERYQRSTLVDGRFEGRRYAVGGPALQRIPRELRRAALSGGRYVEVDIANALPEILNQATGGRYTGLATLCESREEFLHDLVDRFDGVQDRAQAKQLVLAVVFGASVFHGTVADIVGRSPTWLREHVEDRAPSLLALREAVQVAGEELLRKYPKFRVGQGAKARRRGVALALQALEDEVLGMAQAYHRWGSSLTEPDSNAEASVLLFDGYVIEERSDEGIDEVELSEWVRENTGWDLRFTRTPLGPR